MSVDDTATGVEWQLWCHSCIHVLSTGKDVGAYLCEDLGDMWWGSTVILGYTGEKKCSVTFGLIRTMLEERYL